MLNVPIDIYFYLQTDMKKLFECIPAAVNPAVYGEPAKVIFDSGFTPQLIIQESIMSKKV